jgi:hypothetical protein
MQFVALRAPKRPCVVFSTICNLLRLVYI